MRLRISNWYSRNAAKLAGTIQTFSTKHAATESVIRARAGRARANGDMPADRMDGQFAIPGQALVDELDDDEGRDRQDDGDEVRNQQAGQLQEHPHR